MNPIRFTGLMGIIFALIAFIFTFSDSEVCDRLCTTSLVISAMWTIYMYILIYEVNGQL